MFPSTSSRETLRFSGKQNKGADIKCILYLIFELSNHKAKFVAREHEINRDITPYVIN
jgi:hypothetical protein